MPKTTWTVEVEITKRIILNHIPAEDESEAEDKVNELIESGAIYKMEEFINAYDENYNILTVDEE